MQANRGLQRSAQLQSKTAERLLRTHNFPAIYPNRYALRLRLVPQQPVGLPVLDVLELLGSGSASTTSAEPVSYGKQRHRR
jgi:hypothetical protein